MRIRRSRLDIYAEILEVISTRRAITKTHISYHANLSFRQVQKYLSFLLEWGLIREVKLENRSTYEITEKGKLFLESFTQVIELTTK